MSRELSTVTGGRRPIVADEIKRYSASKYKFGWRVWIEVTLVGKMTMGI